MIVTLTTDLGMQDYSLSILKGGLLSIDNPVQLVDVVHTIEKHDIVKAAFIVSNIYQHYPAGTLHYIGVDTRYQPEPEYLLALYKNQYFFAPDNGLFSLLFEQVPEEIIKLKLEVSKPFAFKQLLTHVVQEIVSGKKIQEIGPEVVDYNMKFALQPVVVADSIRGSVVYIDYFGNAILNITKSLFDRHVKGRDFEVYFRRYDPITVISETYADVPVGETLCRFTSSGHLEIAVNMDNASTLLSLEKDDTVQIDFI